jgi:hypothetical protein
MKTDTLIDLLARDAGPAPRALAARRLSPAAIAGLAVSVLVVVGWLGALPAAAFATAVPWVKIAYAGALALAAGWLTARLSQPAAPFKRPQQVLVAIAVLMGLIGLASLWAVPADERAQALLGESWLSCPWRVLALSLPALGAALWAVRGLAPTRSGAAGFAAGLLAGSVGAIGYALSCPEGSLAFVAVWYTLGIALTGLLGAALGPRLLRW